MSIAIRIGNLTAAVCAALLCTVTGCAVDAPEAAESVDSTDQALTTPPVGSGGFTYAGRFHFKNGAGTNLCAFRPSNSTGQQLSTQTCSTSAAQLFDAYQSPVDGRYFMCVPDSLVKGTVGGGCDPFGGCDPVYPGYLAKCLEQSSNSNSLALYDTALSNSKDGGKTYQALPGKISNEGNGILGYVASSKKLTKNSGGVIVLGNYSGNPDQKWTIY